MICGKERYAQMIVDGKRVTRIVLYDHSSDIAYGSVINKKAKKDLPLTIVVSEKELQKLFCFMKYIQDERNGLKRE